VTPGTILDTLKAKGISLQREGANLVAVPKSALTDELRALILAHKPELLEIVGNIEPSAEAQAEASPEDKDFFRAVLLDARIARYAGTDAEDRKAKVLAQLNDPEVKRAMALSPDGTVTVGVISDGQVWTQDLKIPAEKFDPWLILERFEKATLQ
jgi:hypothetical protein